MSNRYFELRDVQRDSLRTACAAIEQALSRLPASPAAGPLSASDELRARWAELVRLLALEPARVLRECPVCKQVGMFEATRCGHCWAKLPVPRADEALDGSRSSS